MLKIRVKSTAPKLMEHQKQSLAYKLKIPVTADLSQVGTGKTASAAIALQVRSDQGDSQRILWITTNTMKEETAKEFHRWTFLSPVVLTGSSENRREQLKQIVDNKCFFIINYDSLPLLEKELIKVKFDSIVCDESSAIKNSKAKRSRALYKIAKNTKFRLIMTGTPLPNTVLDIYGQWKFLEPDLFPTLAEFKQEYCVYVDRGFPILVGYRNLDQLQSVLYQRAIKFNRDECFQLPERTFIRRNVKLSDQQKKLYSELKEEFLCNLDSGKIITVNGILDQIIKLSQITSGFIKDKEGNIVNTSNAKLEELKALLDELDIYNSKAIIWTTFLNTVDILKKELHYLNPGILSGEVKNEDRSRELEKLRSDDSCRVLIAQQSISEGFTINEANVSIYFEHDFSWKNRDQSLGRNYRPGQTKKVLVYDLVCPGTVDVSKLKAIEAKKNVQDLVTNQQIKGVIDGLI